MKISEKNLFNLLMVVAFVGNLGLTYVYIIKNKPIELFINILAYIILFLFQKRVNKSLNK